MSDLPILPGVKANAVLSKDEVYRYTLTRDWFPKERGHVLFVMLNPSVASHLVDDRTIRKCQKFARTWGFDGITVGNLYALRSKEPDDLLRHHDPVGPMNDTLLEALAGASGIGLVVAAWGCHKTVDARQDHVRELLAGAHHLGLTKGGYPRHPLYRPDTTEPEVWT